LSETGRFAVFLTVVLAVWTLMHVYVVSRVWGLASSSCAHRWLLASGAALWLSYPLGRVLAHWKVPLVAYPMELAGAVWMGALFLALTGLLAADLLTGFGFLLPSLSRPVRLAALGLAGLLTVWGTVQGLRSPAVERREVRVLGLDAGLEGLVLVQVSDLHLGTLLGERWLGKLLPQVHALKPDLLLLTGDVIDGEAEKVNGLGEILSRFKAPLGVWAVTGNHEFYAGLDRSVRFLESCGVRVLRDEHAVPAPGLVLAGVDDLTARRQFGLSDAPLLKALEGRPEGTTVLLSHSPLQVEEASALGVDLMLSGHTHGGQIWPFGLLVRTAYPRVEGSYRVGEMVLLVSRGTGTWGPPMRLFKRGEITRVVLRREDQGMRG
jgi:hypothetical protein